MTTGNQLVDNSTLATGTALQHLINPSGDGSGGETIYVPIDTLECSIDTINLNADIYQSVLGCDLSSNNLSADILNINLDGDIITTIEGDLSCH